MVKCKNCGAVRRILAHGKVVCMNCNSGEFVPEMGLDYKTLEMQIMELWASRGLTVLEETVIPLGKNKFSWTIIAERKTE